MRRIAAVLLALLAGLPVAALADLYVNPGPNLQLLALPTHRCHKYGTKGSIVCSDGARGYLGAVVYRLKNNASKTCSAKVFYEKYKPLTFRWHVEAVAAGMPPLATCRYHWLNDNTVDMSS